MDPEEEESLYANDETRNIINVTELLKTHSLEELLKENKKEIKEKEIQNEWFHGRIARDAAEEILKKGSIALSEIQLQNIRDTCHYGALKYSLFSLGLFHWIFGLFPYLLWLQLKPQRFNINITCCQCYALLVNVWLLFVNRFNGLSIYYYYYYFFFFAKDNLMVFQIWWRNLLPL